MRGDKCYPGWGEMGENTPLISKVDKSSVIEFDLRFNRSRDLLGGPKGSQQDVSIREGVEKQRVQLRLWLQAPDTSTRQLILSSKTPWDPGGRKARIPATGKMV